MVHLNGGLGFIERTSTANENSKVRSLGCDICFCNGGDDTFRSTRNERGLGSDGEVGRVGEIVERIGCERTRRERNEGILSETWQG